MPTTDRIEPHHEAIMNRVAGFLGQLFTGYGFALLVFDLNSMEEGRMNYISNADRTDMVTAMKEFIANTEGRAHEASVTKQ